MKKILLVLASEDIADILQDALQTDYHVTICDIAHGDQKQLEQEYDGIIMDLFLPGTDGITFLKHYPNPLPSTVLVLSQYVDQHVLEVLGSLGVSAVFLKPCKISAVKRQLDVFLK